MDSLEEVYSRITRGQEARRFLASREWQAWGRPWVEDSKNSLIRDLKELQTSDPVVFMAEAKALLSVHSLLERMEEAARDEDILGRAMEDGLKEDETGKTGDEVVDQYD